MTGPNRRDHRLILPPRWGIRLFTALIVAACALTASAQTPPDYEGKCSSTDCHGGLLKPKVVHAPVANETCEACHEAKSGEKHKFQLTASGAALCTECHEADLFEGKVVHQPVSAGQCTACHDPHASEFKGLMKGEIGAVCNECHEDLFKDSRYVHGPAAVGACTACHAAHRSAHAALLTGAYPKGLYAGFATAAYQLCLECHEAEVFENAKTVEATAFRNGERNLHFLHVNKATKGRTCRACHEPHASQNPHHIVDHVAFGSWEIPIKYRATETGGSCLTGCHQTYRYDREKPVQNIPALNTATEKLSAADPTEPKASAPNIPAPTIPPVDDVAPNSHAPQIPPLDNAPPNTAPPKIPPLGKTTPNAPAPK